MKKQKNRHDLIFIFKNAKFVVSFDETVDDQTPNDVMDIIDVLAQEITIDGSYVNFPENRHLDTFLIYKGWEKLTDMLYDADFVADMTTTDRKNLIEVYNVMLVSYMVQEVKRYYPDITEHMVLDIDPANKDMTIEILDDNICEWEKYPGKWQTWKIFN